MKLIDLFLDKSPTRPHWGGKYKIPWDEPEFSRRMLHEHLSQAHDLASRKQGTIDEHVDWLHRTILKETPTRILDLGCGPGLYAGRLAALGHTCHGIDFSPASIDYAESHKVDKNRCTYSLGDIRTADYGEGYGMVLLLYGEFNAFPKHEIAQILARALDALSPGGQILIEAHTFDALKKIGESDNSWYKSESGLFSERPHICLTMSDWDDIDKSEEQTFVVIDAETADVTRYTNTLQAYSDDDYRAALKSAGFADIDIIPAWGKDKVTSDDVLMLLTAKK
ncbi:MAG: class I SAM-dependent methyltransferase [Candidatus Zixiibacteriota bacterium]|nr:MAG: class I SAM-dependent methyltransferase [candidate division Zixibacteria bacterium]